MSAIYDDLIAEHIPYEVWMLRQTCDRLHNVSAAYDVVVRNALIESFAIHARNLIDLLDGRNGSDARKFSEAGYLPFAAGRPSKITVRKLSAQIAHITGDRFSDFERKFNGNDIRDLRMMLDSEVTLFRSSLLPRYRDLWDTRPGLGV